MLEFPKEAQEVAKSNLLSLYSKYKNIGFIVPYLTNSQLSLSLLTNINNHLNIAPYDEICIYNCQKECPAIIPLCGIYNQLDIRDHTGPLIAVDPISCSIMNNFYAGPRFYYVYDVALLKYVPPEQITALSKSGTKIFTRTKDYQKELKKLWRADIIDTVVPDFDMQIIKDIVYNV